MDLQKKIHQLRGKREKYQELYAADILSMEELKEKLGYIDREIRMLNLQLPSEGERADAKKTRRKGLENEIESFLSLSRVTNGDLRKIIHRIVVNREGEVKIYLREGNTY